MPVLTFSLEHGDAGAVSSRRKSPIIITQRVFFFGRAQASSWAHIKGRLLMQNRKENTGNIGTHRGVAAVTVY